MKNSILSLAMLIWITISLGFICFKGIMPGWQEEASDFYNYYVSSVLLYETEPIAKFYDNDWFAGKAKELGIKDGAKYSPFPPATAFLYLPLTALPPLTAKRIWTLCNISLLIALLFQAKKLVSSTLLETTFFLSLFVIPIASNIRLGQSYLLFTVLLTSILQGVQSKKNLLSGSLLGIASSLKYLPIVYLVYALPKLKSKLLIGIAAGVAFTISLPIFFDGLDSYRAFLGEFWNHLNGNLSGQGQFSYTFQSADVLLANLFVFDADLNPNPISNFPLLKSIVKLLFIVTVIYLSYRSFKRGNEQTKELTSSIIIFAAFLIIPASATYHLLFLFPALFLTLNFLKNKALNKELTVMLFFIFFTVNFLPHHVPDFSSLPIFDLIIHFPRLYGLMALFVYSIVLQKRHLQTHG